MSNLQILDAHWLTSDAGRALLASDLKSKDPAVAIRELRKKLSPTQSHLLVEQWELRHRARLKFSHPEQLYFTRKSLEQATDATIGNWKANRFANFDQIADLCCGIGGDLISLAKVTTVKGVELDEAHSLLCRANIESLDLPASVVCQNAADFDLDSVDAWHIDPDRRSGTNRTTHVEAFEPDATCLQRMLAKNKNAAMKLAPATLADDWLKQAELNWVGHQRSCQQLIAWFADLAKHPGFRTATILNGDQERTIVGQSEASVELANHVGHYVYEPHAAVLAADLASSLASELRLQRLIPGAGYLTSDEKVIDLAIATFEVIDALPFRAKNLKSALKSLNAGHVELKRRGVELPDHDRLFRQLQGKGERELSVLLMRRDRSVSAIIAKRLT